MAEREHEIVVFGATGFVGKLTAAYLAENAPDDARIALAGRSASKLESVRDEIGGRAAGWPLLEADSQDGAALAKLAASAKVVATTVGPYARLGFPLVEACAAAGTHYADLTGETLFMRRSIDAAHDVATKSGARIVHTCGFDSIPSDIGVLTLHDKARAEGAGDLEETTYVVRAMSGGPSGGTIDSARDMIDLVKRDKDARRVLLDPYALSPDHAKEPDLGSERDPTSVVRNASLGGFLAPFVMGTVNTRVVRRSNALKDYAYGRKLRYRELMLGGGGPLGAAKASAITGGLGMMFAGLALPPTRMVLDRLLPEPGEGPSEAAREKGFFKIAIHTLTSEGAHIVCDVEAQGDPGYKATAVMLGQSALSLARDGDALPDAAGVLTPATAMGGALADRLRAAGHTYEARVEP
jgi:short subunit dehydrogenase-like uncharacterized protein